jgi:D-proline reductase (dithiol) PrdA
MSITNEEAQAHLDSPAIVCCRTTKGTAIESKDLEDPEIFPDMEESGLIKITPDTLTIGEVLGAVLKHDVDGLTSLTADMLDGVKPKAAKAGGAEAAAPAAAPAIGGEGAMSSYVQGGVLHIEAQSITGLNLTVPVGGGGAVAAVGGPAAGMGEYGEKIEDKIVGSFTKQEFAVKEVKLGDKTSFKNGVLTIRKGLEKDCLKADPLVKKMDISIITKDKRHVYSDTVMDVLPIATKVEGELGTGVTNIMNDAVFVLSGVDEAGVQVHEFGSCEGYLDEKVIYGRPGSPDPDDIMILCHAVVQEKTGMERRGPYAAHKALDVIMQEVREELKKAPASEAVKTEKCDDIRRLGRPRVVYVKEIMGQGAMHDNVIFPREPCGVAGGIRNVDLGNVPVVLTVNQVRDGGIHALTCIGPASKENTRHYFREPILERLQADPELDLIGVVFIGSPQVNDEKTFVSKRLGALVATQNVEGAIVTTEGFGNNHIDFSENIEEIGKLGVPVVGVSYCAYQGQLVVGNKYMDAMIEVNRDKGGFESEKLEENTICPEDAVRAVAMLKDKMSGVAIKPAPKKWEQSVIDANQKLVDAVYKN